MWDGTIMKTKIALLAATTFLFGCSSVSDSIPTVKIEKRQSKASVQTASFATESSQSKAAEICETEDMRKKVIDDNDDNDAVRIMVVEDAKKGSRVLSEVKVDCRDYFLRKSLSPETPRIVRTIAPTIQRFETPPRSTRVTKPRLTYVVQRGDTVWDIARQHCTSVEEISRLNGLGRGNFIDVGQRLRLPDVEC